MRRKWRIIVTKCLNKMDVCPVQFAQRPAVTLSVKTVRRRRNALYPGNLTPRRRIDADEAKERKRIHRRRHLEPDVIFYNNCQATVAQPRVRVPVIVTADTLNQPARLIDTFETLARVSPLCEREGIIRPVGQSRPGEIFFFFFFFFWQRRRGNNGAPEILDDFFQTTSMPGWIDIRYIGQARIG